MKTIYKMLPLEKQPGAYVIKKREPVPTIQPNAPRTMYRVVAVAANNSTATVCKDMKAKDREGKLTVVDVSLRDLGYKSVKVGDVLSFAAHDTNLEHPMIAHRFHQSHQFPKQLLTSDEQ